jgi:HK97 family phage major capsid protein
MSPATRSGSGRESPGSSAAATIKTEQPFFRTVQLRRDAINDAARTVRLSVSSVTPYLREDFFGKPYYEILRHDREGIVTDRLQAGTALLFNHKTDQHLGRNISFENDGHKCTVISKFSRSGFASEKWQDVQDEILVDASVGYSVLDLEELDKEIDGIPVYRVRWQPLEASLVTVPADITVGVGRSAETLTLRQHSMNSNNNPQEQDQPINGRTETQERERVQHIMQCAKIGGGGRVPQSDVERAIAEGWSKNKFRDHVMTILDSSVLPLQTPINGGNLQRDSGNHQTSVAEQILTHPEFRRMREGGRKTISFQLPGIRGFREILERATTLTTDVGTTVMQLPDVRGYALERLTVADLLAQGATNAGKITLPQEQSFTPSATNVAEAAAKPEQDFDVEPASATVKKIAAWTKISDELIEDSPAAESYVRTRLGFAVMKQEDTQLISGDGTGANVLGLLGTPGLQTQAKGGDTTLDAIRKGIGKVEENSDFAVTGIVINVHDWTNISLLKDSTGRYLVGQLTVPDEFGRPRLAPSLFGQPVAVSKGIIQGTALVGAFKAAAQLFRRTGLVIDATNSNEDDFKHNLILIRAEERVALAAYAGGAFCQITGLPALKWNCESIPVPNSGSRVRFSLTSLLSCVRPKQRDGEPDIFKNGSSEREKRSHADSGVVWISLSF